MNRQQNQLFRKSSMDQINSPDQLNDYIKVANPSVWITLAAVMILLLGMLTWAVFGAIETNVTAELHVENGVGTAYVSSSEIEGIAPGQQVKAGDVAGIVTGLSQAPVLTESGQLRYAVDVERSGLADGVYTASITLERIHPIHFILQ